MNKFSASRLHNHAAYRTDETGRFVIYKSLHFGCRGPAGSEYYIEDTEEEFKLQSFEAMAGVKCYIALRIFDRKCAPWFGGNAPDGHIRDLKIKLIKHPAWDEIKGN